MKKQILRAGLIISTFFGAFNIAYSMPMNQVINLYINNKLIDTKDMPPVNLNGRVLVPAREVFEPMGALVEWKAAEKKAYILYQDSLLVLEVGNKEAWLNGAIEPLDMPAQIINGKIMLPVRFVSETMGFDVLWQELTQSVYIAGKYAAPGVTNPIVADPIPAEPIVTEPVVTDPVPAEPIVTEPVITEPTVTDPIFNGQNYELDYLTFKEDTDTLAIRKEKNIKLRDLNIYDLYRERKIVIDLGADYSDVYYDLVYEGLYGSITGISVSTIGTTQITLKENTVKAVDSYEDDEYIYIQLVRPKDKYKKIIVIDAGHGGSDPGTSANGTQEKDLNLKYALKAYQFLTENTDVKVYMNREEDETLPLTQRTILANEIEADMFISIHVNSVGNSNINGVEVFYYADSIEGKQMAELAVKNMVNYTGMAGTRGAKPNTGYYVIRTTKMPAILIETGFITNPLDYQRLISDEFAENVGYAVYRTVREAYEQISYE